MAVILPLEMGVPVYVDRHGSVETGGLSKDEELYANNAFGQLPQTLYPGTRAGIGAIDIQIR